MPAGVQGDKLPRDLVLEPAGGDDLIGAWLDLHFALPCVGQHDPGRVVGEAVTAQRQRSQPLDAAAASLLLRVPALVR